MAYQNVGTPRFYIDVFSTMKALDIPYTEGYIGGEGSMLMYKGLWGLENCSMPNWNGDIHHNHVKVEIDEEGVLFSNLLGDGSRENVYIAFLNCKIGDVGRLTVVPQFSATANNILGDNLIDPDEIWTWKVWSSSIANFGELDVDTDDGDINIEIFPSIGMSTTHIGAISMGNIYDMPVSPDLDLSMNIEFDGFDNTQTLNGGTLTNIRYIGSPWWYDNSGNKIEPWSVGESTGVSKRNGRRTWDLKFSYMSDKDLFASNYGSSDYIEGFEGYNSIDYKFGYSGINILPNGDMELASNWTSYSSTSGFTRSGFRTRPGTAGSYSWKFITQSPSDDGMLSSDYSTTLGVEYKITGWVYHEDTDGSGETFKVQPLNANGTVAQTVMYSSGGNQSNKAVFTFSDDSWNYFECYYVEEVGGVGNRIRLTSKSGGHNATYYVDDVNIYPSTLTPDTGFTYTIDDDDSFSAQVLNKISHGQKFIFQPDNTNNNPDQFAICVLDQDSLEIQRVAYNVYDISMKIKEVW